MPGEVKDPTQGVNVQLVMDSLILEKDNSCVSPRLGCLEETTYKKKSQAPNAATVPRRNTISPLYFMTIHQE